MRVALRRDLSLTVVESETNMHCHQQQLQQLQELVVHEDQQQPPQQARMIAQEQLELAEHVAQQQQAAQNAQPHPPQENGFPHSDQGEREHKRDLVQLKSCPRLHLS